MTLVFPYAKKTPFMFFFQVHGEVLKYYQGTWHNFYSPYFIS